MGQGQIDPTKIQISCCICGRRMHRKGRYTTRSGIVKYRFYCPNCKKSRSYSLDELLLLAQQDTGQQSETELVQAIETKTSKTEANIKRINVVVNEEAIEPQEGETSAGYI